ncbi:type II toxin-antitoxin system VapC family toxin [Cyanobacterium aponinum UTEX 3222]|uniref:type II toxin-antitoxin system VapC family toxin n=1 Tax=Cyanobacterium aponinum TaxID=379064 RepID=UPI00308A4FEA|nr:type II toxin-antitoxin system VapC family toxin [Cyanobacterium aponinum UTEX 3222]
MYLLDTNICIAIIKENHLVIEQFKQKYQDCYLSSLVLGELYKGVYCSKRVEDNLDVLNKFIRPFPVVNFNSDHALEFGKIESELRIIGKPTGVVDALLGAIARSRKDILVTNNIRHFIYISNLKIENWLAE